MKIYQIAYLFNKYNEYHEHVALVIEKNIILFLL